MSPVGKLRLSKTILKVSALATIAMVGLVLAMLFQVGFAFQFYLSLAGLAVFLAADVILYRHIAVLRTNLKKTAAARQGHQGEPGSWQCACGRYNTYYRSVCLGCGKQKPNTWEL